MGMACGKCRSHANPRMHSVAYGSFLLTRIRTTTWKAQDAFHTYAQGWGQRYIQQRQNQRKDEKTFLAYQMVNRVETLVRNVVTIGRFSGDYPWPLLR